MRQLHKVKALVEAGAGLLQVMEQLGNSKASYYKGVLLSVLEWLA